MDEKPQRTPPQPTAQKLELQSDATTTFLSAQHVAPATSHHHSHVVKQFLVIVLIILVILVVAPAVYFMLAMTALSTGLHNVQSKCSQQRTQLFSQTAAIMNEFNAIRFTASQPADTQAAPTQQPGDCVDSTPMIFADKQYTLSANAGTTADEIAAALRANGYKLSTDNFPDQSPCSYEDAPTYYVKDDKKITITLTCEKYFPGKANTDWRSTTVTAVKASLIVIAGHNPS